MTNFAFIMDLLKIPSKKFLDIGFDKTQVSRWRRGKLRLMPNRYIVKAISNLFCEVDSNRKAPVLNEILNIWYPGKPCESYEQKCLLCEKFLTEKDQASDAYKLRRTKRLGSLSANGNERVVSKGLDAAKLRILDFFDLVSTLPTSLQIESAHPQGRGWMSADTEFDAYVLKKYDDMFNKGHTMISAIRSDGDVSNFAYSYNNRLVHLLKGYVRNLYFDDFGVNISELFLVVAGDNLALELIEEIAGNTQSTIAKIYTDAHHVENIRQRINKYISKSTTREYFDFFKMPNNYLKYVHISPDSPCYIFTRLPHFGILEANDFANSFTLSRHETEFVNEEITPLLLNPDFFWEYATIRHVFSESAIENALLKKRHQSLELSNLLNRRVWMSTQSLVGQLTRIHDLLKNHKNYEVCFLNDERFEDLKVQIAVWGYGASITWTDEEHSSASRGYVNQRIIQGFCHTAWDNIPEKMKNRAIAMHKIEQWLEKARRYGI